MQKGINGYMWLERLEINVLGCSRGVRMGELRNHRLAIPGKLQINQLVYDNNTKHC